MTIEEYPAPRDIEDLENRSRTKLAPQEAALLTLATIGVSRRYNVPRLAFINKLDREGAGDIGDTGDTGDIGDIGDQPGVECIPGVARDGACLACEAVVRCSPVWQTSPTLVCIMQVLTRTVWFSSCGRNST